MKPHLPIKLLKSIIAASVAFVSIPQASAIISEEMLSGYQWIYVDHEQDVANFYGYDGKVVFIMYDHSDRKRKDGYYKFDSRTQDALLGYDVQSAIFTTIESQWEHRLYTPPITFTGYKANAPLFYLNEDGSLAFDAVFSLKFTKNKTLDSWSTIYGFPSSELVFNNVLTAEFSENSATMVEGGYGGGVIYGGNVTFDGGSSTFVKSLSFSKNQVLGGNYFSFGGAIHTMNLKVNNYDKVTFSSNKVTSTDSAYGGAVSIHSGNAGLSNNGSVVFSKNSVQSSYYDSAGGAIAVMGSTLTISENDILDFSSNSAGGYQNVFGGAIFNSGETLAILANDTVKFSSNSSTSSATEVDWFARGGAVYADEDAIIEDNKSVLFEKNIVKGNGSFADGGAIYTEGTLSIINNTSVAFIENSAQSKKTEVMGAAFKAYSLIMGDNEEVLISKNKATGDSAYGAISLSAGANFNNNGSITIANNSTISSNYGAYGGAIGITLVNVFDTPIEILFANNYGDIIVENNVAESKNAHAYGGAIYGEDIGFTDNSGTIQFIGNKAISVDAYTYGGAICARGGLMFVGNSGLIEFSKNSAKTSGSDVGVYGGAIFAEGDVIFMQNLGDISISDNHVEGEGVCSGSAITAAGDLSFISNDGTISIKNNLVRISTKDSGEAGAALDVVGDVRIVNNKEVFISGNAYINDARCALFGVGVAGDANFSAADSGIIEIQDRLYVQGFADFNEAFTDENNQSIAQTGDILFTAKNVGERLAKIKGKTPSADDVLASSEYYIVEGAEIHDGRLRIEDGAIFRTEDAVTIRTSSSGQSTPTLLIKDATAIVGGDVVFESGTCLDAQGQAVLDAYEVVMEDGSQLKAKLTADNMEQAVLSLHGDMIFEGALTITLDYSTKGGSTIYKILTLADKVDDYFSSTWNNLNVTLEDARGNTLSGDDLYWDGNSLMYLANVYRRTTNETLTGENTSGRYLIFGNRSSGTVRLGGLITPKQILVDNDTMHSYIFEGNAENYAYFAGSSSLIKRGSGSLTINMENHYRGGTMLEDGTLIVGHEGALGSGELSLWGGTLNLNGYAVNNTMRVDGDVNVLGGENFLGQLRMLSGSLSGDALNLAYTTTLRGGRINANLIGAGGVVIDTYDEVELAGTNTYQGSTIINNGTLLLTGSLSSDIVIRDRGVLNTGLGLNLQDGQTLYSENGTIVGNLTSSADNLEGTGLTIDGNLHLTSGSLTLGRGHSDEPELQVNGTLEIDNGVKFDFVRYQTGSVIVLKADGLSGSVNASNFSEFMPSHWSCQVAYDQELQALVAEISGANEWIWDTGKSGVLKMGSVASIPMSSYDPTAFEFGFREGDTVYIDTSKSTITLEGDILGNLDVRTTKSVTFKSNKKSPGAIAGRSAVFVSGSGSVTMNDGNTYSGGTYLNGGTLKAGGASSFGVGDIVLSAGSLDLAKKAVANDVYVYGDVYVKNGSKYQGSMTVNEGSLGKKSSLTIQEGETLTLSDSSLIGTSVSGAGTVYVSGMGQFTSGTKVTTNKLYLDTYANLEVDSSGLAMNKKASAIEINKGVLYSQGAVSAYSLMVDDGCFYTEGTKARSVTVTDLVLTNGSSFGSTGKVSASNLLIHDSYLDVYGISSVQGLSVKYDSELVNSRLSVSGSVSGRNMVLTGANVDLADPYKNKAQNFTLKGDLSMDSLSEIRATGKLSANNLSMVDSLINVTGTTGVQSMAIKYDSLLESSTVNIHGTMSGRHLNMVNSAMNLTDPYKNKAQKLTLKGALEMSETSALSVTGKLSANYLTMDDSSLNVLGTTGVQSLAIKYDSSLTDSSILVNGSMSGRALSMDKSTLSLSDPYKGKAQGLSLKGLLSMKNGAKITTTGKISSYGIDMTNAEMLLDNVNSAQSLTVKGQTNMNLAHLDINGTMSTYGLSMADSSINLEDENPNKTQKAKGLTAKGDVLMDSSSITATGAVSAYNLNMVDGSTLSILGETSAQSLKVKYDTTLNGSDVLVNGAFSGRHLNLINSKLTLTDPYKGKAQGLSLSGDFTMDSGSILSLSGKLSAKNITFNGGTLNLTGSSLGTIAAKYTLSFNNAIDLNMDFDYVLGKSYTLFTFKSIVGDTSDLYSLLGLDDECCDLAFNKKGTAITLTVTDADLWESMMGTGNVMMASVTDMDDELMPMVTSAYTPEAISEEVVISGESDENAEGTPALAATASDEAPQGEDAGNAEGDDEEEESGTPTTTQVELMQMLAGMGLGTSIAEPDWQPVTDSLVQSTWGVANASRAFVNVLDKRGQNAMMLGQGKGAAWLSTFGGLTRLSSGHGHAGSDYNLTGAAMGMEVLAGESTALGLALGHSWGKISTFSAYALDQDSAHVALYGSSKLSDNLNLEWSLAYGNSETEGNLAGADADWNQDSVQADVRVSRYFEISHDTQGYVFGAMQYLATDSATIAEGVETGSVQNLRGEIGVGVSTDFNKTTALYGELSFIGDMVRHNPTASVADFRKGGANPSRVGMNVGVGINHALSEHWSLNAGYNVELMKRATSHSANIGATYKF